MQAADRKDMTWFLFVFKISLLKACLGFNDTGIIVIEVNQQNKTGTHLHKWVASWLIYKESISIT